MENFSVTPADSPYYILYFPFYVSISPPYTPDRSVIHSIQSSKNQCHRCFYGTFPEKLFGIFSTDVPFRISFPGRQSVITDPFLRCRSKSRSLVIKSQTYGIEYRTLPGSGLSADQEYGFISQRLLTEIYPGRFNGCYIFYYQ